MASVVNQDNEEEKTNTANAPQTASFNQPMAVGGASPAGVISGSGSGGRTPGSGSFTNLQSYLEANKDFKNDSGTLGQGIQKNLETEADKTRQGIQSAQNKVDSSIKPDEQVFNNGNSLLQNALSDPTKFVQDQGNLQNFTKLRTGQFGFDPLQAQQDIASVGTGVNDFQNLANQAQTETGRFGLLQRAYGNPTYGRGQQRLDQLLLQASPEQGSNLASTATQLGSDVANQSKQYLNDDTSRLNALLANKDQYVNSVNSALGDEAAGTGALGQFDSGIDARVSSEQAHRDQLYQQAQDFLKQYHSTDNTGAGQQKGNYEDPGPDFSEAQKLLGLTNNSLLPVSGLYHDGDPTKPYYNDADIQDLLNQSLTKGDAVNRQNISTQDDLAKYNALNQLAGKQGTLYQNGVQQLNDPLAFKQDVFNNANQKAFDSEMAAFKAKYPTVFNYNPFDPNSAQSQVERYQADWNANLPSLYSRFGRTNEANRPVYAPTITGKPQDEKV